MSRDRLAESKLRKERRAELQASIDYLKKLPASELRDLKIRVRALERDLVDSFQITEHYQYREGKLRDELRRKGYSESAIDEIAADWRIEGEQPVPACRACGKTLC